MLAGFAANRLTTLAQSKRLYVHFADMGASIRPYSHRDTSLLITAHSHHLVRANNELRLVPLLSPELLSVRYLGRSPTIGSD